MRLQVALDLTDYGRAVELARELCAAGAELVEAGTPLIKAFGLSVVGVLKAWCGRAEVVADIKAADTGRLEARLARLAGADWATVLGATNLETVEEFVDEARRLGMRSMVDMIGVADPVGRALEIARRRPPDAVVLHVGIDVQTRAGVPLQALVEAAERIRREGVAVAVAGGMTEREVEALASRGAVDIVVVGRAITADPSPVSKFLKMDKILKGAGTGPA